MSFASGCPEISRGKGERTNGKRRCGRAASGLYPLPDVILPVNLWVNYDLDQSTELPAYDFCYSAFSKKAFLEETGIDIDKVERPEQSLSWRSFRYRQITKVVNHICDVAKE